MDIAIFGRNFNPRYKTNIANLFKLLKDSGCKIYVHYKFEEFLESIISKDLLPIKGRFHDHDDLPHGIELLFSIGGDGTILEAITIIQDKGIPIVGINTGKLGFLANIAIDEIPEAIDMIHKSKYTIDERTLLEVSCPGGNFADYMCALNEISIQKKDTSMIIVHAYVDGEFLNTYWADGLIISTPTGSTAYSLSVGGPIIYPQSDNFIIAPISPHNLTVRPLVVSDRTVIRLKLEKISGKVLVSLDHRYQTLDNTVEMEIKKAKYKVKLLKCPGTTFYKTLRGKLMWGMDRRN